MSTTKPTAFVPKPTASRYRRGKAPTAAGAALSDSDSDSDAEEEDQQEVTARRRGKAKEATARASAQERLVAGGAGRVISVGDPGKSSGVSATQVKREGRAIQVALRDVKVEDGAVIVGGQRQDEGSGEDESSGEEESSEEEDRKPVFTRPGSKPGPAPHAEESSEYETDSEDESEEDKAPVKPIYRPTFVPKRARETVLAREAEIQAEVEALARKDEEALARKKESRDLVGETIRRAIAERELTEMIPDVDDTDDLDPSAEFDDWRLRELSRLARDKEASMSREEEREEIERRKAMPEEQRLREDLEHVRQQEEEKKANRGERGFLEKFWHKGAFHQDDEILKRNYNVKLESAVDISSLPKIMQVKNYGKMSRSKYTHLKDQDTTQEGWDRPLKSGSGGKSEGCFNCGGPHLRRDCPNNNMSNEAGPSFQPSDQAGTGTNSATLGIGSRNWGSSANGGDASRSSRNGSEPGHSEAKAVQDDYRSPRVDDRRKDRREQGEERSRHADRRDSNDERGGREKRERDDRAYRSRPDEKKDGPERGRDDRYREDDRRTERDRSRSPQREYNRRDEGRRR